MTREAENRGGPGICHRKTTRCGRAHDDDNEARDLLTNDVQARKPRIAFVVRIDNLVAAHQLDREGNSQMKLHQIAVAVAALSMAGAAIAGGKQATTSPSSSDQSYSAGQQQGQQAGTSASPQAATPSSQQAGTPSSQAGMSSSQAGTSSSPQAGAAAGEQKNPALVRSAQQALKDKGHDVGAIDGQMGPSTESALRSFQQAQGLPQSGNLDQQTLAALGVQQDPSAMQNQGSQSSANQGSTQNPSATQDKASTSSTQSSASAK